MGYRFLEENFKFFDLDKTEEFINKLNNITTLSKEEKLKIINYKPENIVELSIVNNFL